MYEALEACLSLSRGVLCHPGTLIFEILSIGVSATLAVSAHSTYFLLRQLLVSFCSLCNMDLNYLDYSLMILAFG